VEAPQPHDPVARQHGVPSTHAGHDDGAQPPPPDDPVEVPHDPPEQAWLDVVQSLQEAPPVPQSLSAMPGWQLPPVSQQPVQVCEQEPPSAFAFASPPPSPAPASDAVRLAVSPEPLASFAPPSLPIDELASFAACPSPFADGWFPPNDPEACSGRVALFPAQARPARANAA